jgi:hypothetical protein
VRRASQKRCFDPPTRPTSAEVEVSGQVDKRADAAVGYRYHYQGEEATASSEKKISGALKKQHETLSATPQYSRCGTTTTLVQGLTLRILDKGATAPSSLTVDYASGVKMAWKACK